MDDPKANARKSPATKSGWRRRLKGLLAFGLFAGVFVGGLPWLLGTPPAREWIVDRVNARLAPGSIELAELKLSWTGPIELDRVLLIDPRGKTVLASDRVTLDRGLFGLVASRPDYGIITIEGATVDLERHADGTIDLLEAIAAVMKPAGPSQVPPGQAPPAVEPAPPSSPIAVTVALKSGTLRLASPELVEPFEAKTLEGSLKVAPGRPTEGNLTLGGDGRSIDVSATADPAPAGDFRVSIVGKDWPIHLRHAGVETKGRFAGQIKAKRGKGLWSVAGETTLANVEAAGPTLQGDRLTLDRVIAASDLEETPTGWAIRKLDLHGPVFSIQGAGTIPAADGSPTRVEGKVDLARLAKMLPNAMRLRGNLTLDRGTAAFRLEVSAGTGVDHVELIAGIDDFAATEAGRAIRLRRPISLAARATRSSQKIAVEAIEVKAAGVDIAGSGDLRDGVKLTGGVDLVALMDQLRDVLDLGPVDLAGKARLAADYRHASESYKGRFAVEINGLKVVGLTTDPVVRDQARLEGWAVGASKLDGTPNGWLQARLDLVAGPTRFDLQAIANQGNPSVAATIETPIVSPVAGRFGARAKLRKSAQVLIFDELIAGVTPGDPDAASGAVTLAVRGQFDPTLGEGVFGPIPGQSVGVIGIRSEGAKVSGVGRSDRPLMIEAALVGDLAALDRLLVAWNGTPTRGLGGLWAGQVSLTRSKVGKVDLDGKLFVPDLTVSAHPRGPVSLTLQAGYIPDADRLDMSSLSLSTKYGRVGLVGGMVETRARKFFDVTGTLEPDWSAIDPIVASTLEPTAQVRASARTIHLAGMLKADSTSQLLGQISGEVRLDVTTAKAFGLTLGATPVVLRMGGGLAKFDPIRSTLNDGTVSIVADLAADGELGVWLRVGSSKVEGATINEAVSDAILAYVAPVLAKSSQVSGKVAVAIDRAFVPITAKGSLALDGAMAFQNVTFDPGALASELNAMTGQVAHKIRLNEAMFVKVANGRVEQHGLSIPVGGNGLKVAIDGSVGFDETLDLKATVPLSPKALGLAAGPDDAPGLVASLPVRGTLARPAIDRKAFGVALRDAARSFGEKRLKTEAGRLLERIASPGQGSGEPRSKPANRNPLGDLENLGREILDPKSP